MSFTVAIVGRPNVGKSTLFNRLIGSRDAIVDDISGVTRDRKYGESYWNGKVFNVIDTGGFVPNSSDIFETAIREQVAIAMEEASLIVFVTDVTTGITDLDEAVARTLHRAKKTVLLAVNKVDNHNRLLDAQEFYSLNFDETFFIASMTGSGTGELLDALVQHIPDEHTEEYASTEDKDSLANKPHFAIVGQPNVGKSSLINALIGETRNIVSNIPGTTRDAIDTHYKLYNKDFVLIDTAGIRKKAKVKENLEFYSVMRAITAIDRADVCLLLIDATLGIESQDLNIFRLAQNKKKGIVVLVNKWDLVEKETNTARDFEAHIKYKLAPLSDVPVIFVSALEKQRIFKAIEEALEVYERRKQHISTHQLNEFLREVVTAYPPPSHKSRHISINYVTQIETRYPTFVFFSNHPRYIKDAYRGYLENKLREKWNFTGVPITIFFREK